MPQYTFDWFTPHISNWEKWLAPLKGQPVTACEIGCFEGRSAVWLCENILTHPDSVLACVEPFLPYPHSDRRRVKRWFLSNTEQHRADKRLFHYQTTSQKFLDGKREVFDLIYIDGEHSFRGVISDATLGWVALKPGGLIIFDDYRHAVNDYGVKKAVDTFLHCIDDKYTLIGQEYQFCIQKKGDNAA